MITKTCRQCQKSFTITEQDDQFYRRIDVPQPQLCPDCRYQRRLVWRNERTLYARQCDLCHKAIISIYRPTSPYTVYCYDCWYSDKWNPLDYGQAIDFTRPFFEQFKELQLKVPRLYAFVINNENCDYTNGTLGCKDCYMIFASDHDEHCLYSYGTFYSTQSVDLMSSTNCELCYECIGCSQCYAVQYSEDCSHCHSSMFLVDCKGCSDCFMSYGLRNRQYVWKNQQLTADEYQAKLARLKRDQHDTITQLRAEFSDLKKKHIFKYYHGQNNEHCSGDYLENCSHSQYCFDSFDIQHCKYITHGNAIKDTYDGYMNVDGVELGYELIGSMGAYHVKFAAAYYGGRECDYMDTAKQVNNSFGCVGLQRQQFCILNRSYPEADYHSLRAKLVAQMKQAGEYGEHFPITCSPFAYNETAAQDMFPLTQAEVAGRGWQWYEAPIKAAPDQTNQAVSICQHCQKNFRMIASELKFYQDQMIPLPTLCFDCRHRRRLANRNPRALWQRQCMCTQPDHRHQGRCPSSFETAYSAHNPTIVYCEQCYQKEVY